MSVPVKFLHPRATADHVGLIPLWLNPSDPRPARDQLHTAYAHGGGWHSFQGFTFDPKTASLTYPEDPAYFPIAVMHLRDETIYMYQHAWVCIVQLNGSHEVARMD